MCKTNSKLWAAITFPMLIWRNNFVVVVVVRDRVSFLFKMLFSDRISYFTVVEILESLHIHNIGFGGWITSLHI